MSRRDWCVRIAEGLVIATASFALVWWILEQVAS